jgi:type II secretory pathway component PulF
MPRYRYRAARRDGSLLWGVIEASSQSDMSGRLTDRGLVLIDAAAMPPASRRAAPIRDLAMLFQSLASLVTAGLPIEKALAASEGLVRGPLRALVGDARRQLREGRTLTQALGADAGLVPGVVLGMLRAGEHGSQLGAALDEVARHLEREAALTSHVRHALAYPILLGVAGTVTVGVLVSTVIPRFAELLAGLDVELPPATRLLLEVSGAVSRFGVLLLLAGVVAGVLFWDWRRRPAGARAWEECLLALPLVGPIRLALATSRMGRALGGMLRSGLPLLKALEFGREAAGNVAVARRLDQVREEVREGATLTPALERARAMSPSALQLVGVGEASGQLAPMMARAGDLAGQEAERGLATLVGLLEPALIVAFGGLVAFVAAALLQAVYAIRAV